MKREDVTRIGIPKRFHAILKLEAYKKGKPMTSYMDEIAEQIETKYGSIEKYFKRSKKDDKKKKEFDLRF